MKILVITQKVNKNDPVLGFFHAWINEFSKKFEHIHVICLEKGEMDLPRNVSVFSLGKEEGVSRAGYLARFFSEIISKRKEYDAVFVHMNQIYVILGVIIWKLYKKQIFLWYTHKSVTPSLRLAVALSDKILTASKESFRIKNKKVNILGHGIDTNFFRPETKIKKDSISLITIGRISPVKNYKVLIEAFSKLQSKINFSLSIVGDPVTEIDKIYAQSLRDLVQKSDFRDKVIFKGSVKHDDVPALLSGADIFVNMSKTGSMDKAVLEAMACGIPTITSNPAFESTLSPYGLFFKDNDVDHLVRIIETLAKKESDITKIGLDLRAIVVREHDLSSLVSKIADLYNKK